MLDDAKKKKPKTRKKKSAAAKVEIDAEETPIEISSESTEPQLSSDKEKSNVLSSVQFLGIMTWSFALIVQLQVDGTLAIHCKLFFYLVACFLEIFILKYLTFEAETYIDTLKNVSE